MAEETTPATKPIKITETADRAIEAYLGWQRGIGETVSKQEVLEAAVIHFVNAKMPSQLLKVFKLPEPN